MGGKYKTYPEYKESGIEWLGELPVSWVLKKIKYLAHCFPSNVDKKSKDGEQSIFLCNYTDVYYNEQITSDLTFMKATATNEQIKKFTLKKDDVIITKDSEDPEDIAVPAVVQADLDEVICGYHLSMVRANKDNNGQYLKRVFDSKYARSVFSTTCNGLTRYGLGSYAIDNTIFPRPPLDEQTIIATYLDRETAKIDTLIEKQQQLIKLLKEKRQAVISHAVTKGLNPDVKMKDSGVEWLGEVPEHWEIIRVKFVAKLESGHTPNKKIPEYWESCNIPWVSLNDSKYLATHDYISNTAYMINEKGLAGSSARLLPSGAVVFTRDATIGLTAITTREMAVSQHLIAWLPKEKIISLFLLRIFNSMTNELNKFTFGSTIKTIGMDDVKILVTTVPPINEQQTICSYIEKKIKQLDVLIQKSSQAIELLKERRTALISAAVTGKIDVRQEVIT